MKKIRIILCVFLVFAMYTGSVFAQESEEEKSSETQMKEAENDKLPLLVINGTNKSGTISVDAQALQSDQPINITVSGGFSVSPSTIPANAKNAKVTVTYNGTKEELKGKVIMRSGDIRSYVNVKGLGTPLQPKDISNSPILGSSDAEAFVKTVKDGFKPTNKGYTVEFKVKTDNVNKEFSPFMLDDKGVGFKAYVNSSSMGIYSSTSKKGMSNPVTSVEGGLNKFYNDDSRFHVYRYSVTPDNRVFVYRDGQLISTVRAVDYGSQPDFAVETGDPVENLLKNSDFEGEFDNRRGGKIAEAIEGWDIAIGDIYNSEQYILKQEISNEQDFNNQILQMKRYKWSDGWSAAEIGQVVDVAPNETYTLSALVRGGIKAKEGTLLGKIKIQEVQDRALGTSVDITSDSWETYSMDYTTSAACKQIRVFFYLERDKWGATISPLDIDNVKLTGKSRIYSSKVGFENKFSNVEYFTYDLSGAYAPLMTPEIKVTVGK